VAVQAQEVGKFSLFLLNDILKKYLANLFNVLEIHEELNK
jgi:hypothetical protein